MEDGTHNWNILFSNYMNRKATAKEEQELLRQKESSIVKQRQFNERTNPVEFFKQVERVRNIDTAEPWNTLAAELSFAPVSKRMVISKRLWRNRAVAIAATLLLFIAGGLFWYNRHPVPPVKVYSYIKLPDGKEIDLNKAAVGLLYEDDFASVYFSKEAGININAKEGVAPQMADALYSIITAPGTTMDVRLPDDTYVTLNKSSTLITPGKFAGNERKVRLNGEALFAVATNKKVPFTVSFKEEGSITVTGTLFNINSYHNKYDTATLLEGEITLQTGNTTLPLMRGEQVVITGKGKISSVKKPDLDSVIAWAEKEHDIVVNDKTMQDVLQEVGRQRGYVIQFTTNDIKSDTAVGTLTRNTDIDTLIKILENRYRIIIKKEGRKLIVSPGL